MTGAPPLYAVAHLAAEVGLASRTLRGESVSGDLHFLQASPGGLLIGLIDGLGHGRHAHWAAHTAAAACILNLCAPLDQVLRACHFACVPTRGVVLTLARIDLARGLLEWVGVGNVEACVLRGKTPRKGLRLWSGLVGQRLPAARVESVPLEPGDLLVMATDGVKPGFADDVRLMGSTCEIASAILEGYGRDTDDATVVVWRAPASCP